ncbi:SusC/RagA family TonB-linked outer membrane protein [Prevotella sp. oral taxon 376]|uniref:SusC/RagA family TonB-linked outer membrane protein n=1 Tax=Prevotella sp. oral taxon 376 TaxID=712466 RepID=UPI000D1DE63B|nr:TonB-dependent receptor [Prevotella sp. oral taxon 376]PTL34233.1 SusC/RagA family TonB-linked outer membrane protein [Prevotella sp. oral taxon 376]
MKQLGKWQHMPVYLKMLMTACTLSCYCPAAVAAESTAKAGSIQQQQDSFSGVVVDEKNDPLIGVTIQVKGTSSRTVTDTDGRFTLPAGEKSATLVVSYVGYSTKEVRVSAGRTVNISLHPDDQTLEEVIVTGYGTFKKSAYAGSASTLKTEKLEDVPTATFKDLLQGAASGVQMSSASGQPGSSVALNIRGMGSFNASNSPLYVIDGVPVMSGNVSANDSKGGFDLMSTLSNTDIESITVIKDAAAASLYGSRAANGVVLITTKKGREGKPVVNLKADWGSSDFAMDYRPVMNGEQRREYIYNALKAGALRDGKSEADAVSYADSEIDNYAPVPWCGYVDWDRILFKKGSHQSYEASVSGGTNRFTYYTSLSYLKQQGIARNSGLERISGRVNAEYKATKKFTLGVKSLFASVNQEVYSEGTSYTAPFYASRNCVVPSDAVYNEDGSWNRSFIRNEDRNPALSMMYDYKREYITRHFNTVYGEYEFIKDLKFRSTLSYDYTTTKGKEWDDPRTSNGDDINGGKTVMMYERKKLVWANQLSYKTTLAENHHLDALLGYEVDDQRRDHVGGTKHNFVNPNKDALSNGAKVIGAYGSDTRTRMVSYIGRLNYDYKNRYYLGGSLRVDGSSRLASANRWGTFWSASGAWRIIEEDFMKPSQGWLTDLKLRASYGVNGTLPSDYFGYMALTSLSGDYNTDPAYNLSQIANDKLSWETNYNFNLGVDFGLWNRLNVTLEYYTRTTKNLLMDYPISWTTGFGSYLLNIGKVRNQGVELEIRSNNISTKDFSWNTNFTLAHNQNKIVILDGKQQEIISGTFIHRVGESYRTFYLIEFAGINPDTGAPQFYTNTKDADGNLVKNITENPAEANNIAYKHAEPTVTGGLSNTLSYKWFDLNFMITYQFGGYSYDTWAQKVEHGGKDLEANIPTYYLNNWKQPGDISQYERFIEAPEVSMGKFSNTRRVHSTDFIRLKNLTFGFTMPKAWTKPLGINHVRLYVAGNNLLTWARYDYYDPEAVSGGTAGWGTPPLKTITFGLNVNF